MIPSQIEQCEPSVNPGSVHVGATASSTTTSKCPNAASITVCLSNSISHTLQ